MKKFVRNENGGVEIYILALLAISFLVLLTMYQWNANSLVVEKQRVKLILDRAVHAASLDLDGGKLKDGVVELDRVRAPITFSRYLQSGLSLDDGYNPLSASFLSSPMEIERLEFVASGPFPRVYEYTGTLLSPSGPFSQTIREVLEGPSVFAVLRLTHRGIGTSPDTSYFVAAVEEVKW